MNTVNPKTSPPASVVSPVPALPPFLSRAWWPWLCLLLPLGYLWFHLVDNLRLEWSTNPQYSYGLVVPLLVAGLLLRRWQLAAASRPAPAAAHPWLALAFCGLLAFLYLPTRLIEAATPEWRPLQWCLALEVVGLTLYAAYLAGGTGWLRQIVFPVAFFLIAVPWPSPIETPIIQGLSRMNSALVVAVLGIIGVPAIQHGNVIEVSTGVVGINDACSGIRSLQSSLMISLFLGEFFRLGWRRRLLLVPISIGLAMALNLCRTSLLTWLTARKGIGAIAEYHDEAGMTILLVCTALLWVIAWWLKRRSNSASAGSRSAAPTPVANGDGGAANRRRAVRFGIILLAWVVAVEGGVELWYRIRESHLQPGPNWVVKLPDQNPTYRVLPFTREEHELLRFDDGCQGAWSEPDGTTWEAFYYDWLPGRVAGYLAKRHTPDICMTATGYKQLSGPDLMVLNVKQVELPVRHYIFAGASGPVQVYQCHWEAGMGRNTYTADESSRFNLIRGIWAGRGNHGQKVLEIVISGYDNPELARQALTRRLDDLIAIQD
jgi:exosortase